MTAARTCLEPGCQATVTADATDGRCFTCRVRLTMNAVPDPTSPVLAKDTAPLWPHAGHAPHPNSMFGPYELVEKIASGGMGVVYRARHVKLNRTVALKMILTGLFASTEDIQRFLTEAEAVAGLDHPNIVPIYEIGEEAGQHYFSMKLIEGTNLSNLIPASVGDPRGAARRVAAIARAIHYAHQHGILHRDLKPGNILIGAQGEPYVTDFGLAKRIETKEGLTESGIALGTPGYMSPEQACGDRKAMTTAIDVYSLGVVLYEMITGRMPFQGRSPAETLRFVMEKDPPSPRSLNPRVDRDLETICLKCLEKSPKTRYGSAEALAEDLDHWQAGEPIRARRITAFERGVKWARRRPILAALIAVSASALLTFTGGVAWFSRRLHRELGVNEQVRRELHLALTRQVVYRLESDHRRLAALPQSIAIQLAKRADWSEEQLLATLSATLQSEPQLYGLCLAFEPFQFDRGREDYALYMYRASGGLQSVQLSPATYQPLYREWTWYREPKSRRQPLWIDPYYDKGGGQVWMTTYAVPFERDGKFIGVVTADFSIKAYAKVVREWLEELKMGADAYGFVIDQTGLIVTHPESGIFRKKLSELAAGSGANGLAMLAERIGKQDQGTVIGLDARSGRLSSFVFAKVPSSGWYFVAVVPESPP